MTRPRIAYAGAPGAFAEMACRAFRPHHQPVPYRGFAEAIAAVREGAAELAAIPVENVVAGPVPGIAELLGLPGCRISAEYDLAIAMHCLGLPGAVFGDIAEIRSHPVALRQCARFLAETGWKQVPDTNSAIAARELGRSGDPARAVLASQRTADLYDLAIIARDVQDEADNRTRFAIVERA